MLYRIARNFRGRKFSRVREIEHFANNNYFRKFSAIALPYSRKLSRENIFANFRLFAKILSANVWFMLTKIVQ